MIKPSAAFFPFTYISADIARACKVRFGPVILYQPARGAVPEEVGRLEKQGEIVLRYPSTQSEDRLLQLARRFQDWGAMHEKASAAVKEFAESGFYNQEFAPEISTEILKGPKEQQHGPEPLFNAGLFLLLAQEYDRQTAELEKELSQTDKAARELFQGIKDGLEDYPGFSNGFDESVTAPDPGGYMTESRLRAWNYLLSSDPEPPAVLVTSSLAVIGVLKDRFDGMSAKHDNKENIVSSMFEQGEPGDGYITEIYEIQGCNRLVCLLVPDENNPEK